MKNLPHVAPFSEGDPKPPSKRVDTQGSVRLATMLASFAALSTSTAGAVGILLKAFKDGPENMSLDELYTKVLVLGLAFAFSWGCGLVSIRSFGNLFYPMVMRLYAWGCLLAVCVLYLYIIGKLYAQDYSTPRFWMYLITLLSGLFVVFCLHLLTGDDDLRPFSIPLLIVSVVHLFAIVVLYVFTPNIDYNKVDYDLAIFFAMSVVAGLMLAHLGFFSPLRKLLDRLFSDEKEKV
ncbi:MAG TPA: hypothetical protein PK989_08005 [Anaerolineales bacterium]|nr:hypothetical protein [Anaerolineales bacterium]